MDEILASIKKLLGIDESYTVFDDDLIIHINSVLAILTQLGVGPPEGYTADDMSTWADFLGSSTPNLNGVRTYVYLKVKLLFDPPSSSSIIESINRTISELEWRLNVTVDKPEEGG